MTRLFDSLDRMAEEGSPRGHAEVMRAARASLATEIIPSTSPGRHRSRKIAGALVVLVGVVAGLVFVATRDSQSEAPVIAPPAHGTAPITVPTTTVPPTTVAPTITPPLGEDRLSSDSRLGYAGLGPIKLGMAFPDAERLGQVTIRPDICPEILEPEPGSGLDRIITGNGTYSGFSVWAAFPFTDPPVISEIDVGHPAIYTISGVHVGSTYDDVLRTYPNAVETKMRQADGSFDPLFLAITGPEGRTIRFHFGRERTVSAMTLGLSEAAIEGNSKC